MGDVTANCTFEITAGIGHTFKEVKVFADATVDDGDTFTFTLANAGATAIVGVAGFIATTSGSVVEAEAPTTSVTSGVLTVTVGGSTDNKERFYILHLK
jgi:hypothetical protein